MQRATATTTSSVTAVSLTRLPKPLRSPPEPQGWHDQSVGASGRAQTFKLF
jgi:hypothetical protein